MPQDSIFLRSAINSKIKLVHVQKYEARETILNVETSIRHHCLARAENKNERGFLTERACCPLWEHEKSCHVYDIELCHIIQVTHASEFRRFNEIYKHETS